MPCPPPANTNALALIHEVLVGEALENGPVAVFVFDDEGRYLAVNRFACQLLGYQREELLRRCVGELSVQPQAAAIDSYLDAIRTGAERETVVLHKDGRRIRLRFSRDRNPCRGHAGVRRHSLAR